MGYSKDYLRKVSSTWYYYRRTPRSVAHLDKRTFVKKSLKTDSHDVAKRRSVIINNEIEAYWSALLNHRHDDSRVRYESAMAIAKSFSFSHAPMTQILSGGIHDITSRLEKLEESGSIDNPAHVSALLGSTTAPCFLLSDALEEFWSLTQDTTRKKTKRELRRWQNPRKKAVRNFIEQIGNKDLTDISRNDALDFRQYWLDRIQEEDLRANTANKDLGHLAKIFAVLNDKLRLNLDNPFTGLHLSEKGDQSERAPFEPDYIQNTLLNPENLSGLNKEAMMLLFAMADTGCGFNELTGLDPTLDEIKLDEDIPYIFIKANKHRALKTSQQKDDYRRRKIPLVGAALYALQECPNGFPSYRGKQDSASTTVNKYLRSHKLLPSPNHSAYSLRHSFEDRLTAAEVPEKVAAALMGHKFYRPKYGDGPSLELKKKWLQAVAFKTPT